MDRAKHFASARNLMVDGQVRPNRVYDSRVLGAMRSLPRERFAPPGLAARAHADEDLPIGDGRCLTEPLVVARLVQLAAVRRGDRALVVAAGSGYAAALLAACEASVIALDDAPGPLALARGVLTEVAPMVRLVEGRPEEGWPADAPYDVILIDGAVEEVPEAITRQLRPAGAQGGGRLVTVRRDSGMGQCVLGEVIAGQLRLTPAFDAATPVLSAFRRQAGFVF